MKPLNRKERNKALYKVMGWFVASLLIVVLVGFSTLNIPNISESKTKAELEKLKNQMRFQEEVFGPNVGKTTALISKIPSSRDLGENIEVLNQDIGALISTTKGQVIEDESWESNLYKDVIKTLSDLQLAYNERLNLIQQAGNKNELEQKLLQCMTEKNQLQNQINMLQANSGGGGGGDCAKLKKELESVQQKLTLANMENEALKREIDKTRGKKS